MDEIWERAVETALDGQTDVASVRTLTLDSAVKCVHGRLPAPSLLDRFQNLQHLSIANIGVSSLEHFPRLRNLQRLILSDNRIAGGLEFLVQAGLESLRDLDLSNNRISDVDVLKPLAELRLVSLDLYECPVTRVKDYRSLVFGLIRSLRYLDKMDVDGNERPESDEEDGDEDEEEEDDPGSGEIDGEDRRIRLLGNGDGGRSDGVVEVDEDEESDADEEETVRGVNVSSDVGSSCRRPNGFMAEGVCLEDEEDEEYGGEDDDDDLVDEVDEDVVEVHEVESDDEEDGVEDDEDGDDDEDEEVDNDEMDFGEPESNGRLTSTEGEIDGHEQGEEDADEDDDGETGEEELALGEDVEFDDEEDAEDEEEDNDNGYLVQPVGRAEVNAGCSDVRDEDDPEVEEEDDDDGEVQEMAPSSSSHKRKRDDSEEDDDDDSDEDSEDEDIVEPSKSSKHR